MSQPTPVQESARHVTDDEARAVAEFAADIGEFLTLPRYRFTVMLEPCEEHALATIHTVKDRWIAEIYLCESWMERSDSERMNTVIHEVCHLLHRGVDQVVLEEAARAMHSWEHDAIRARYRRETELMVDHLANFVSDFASVEESWKKFHRKKK